MPVCLVFVFFVLNSFVVVAISLVVRNSAVNCLEIFVFEMTWNIQVCLLTCLMLCITCWYFMQYVGSCRWLLSVAARKHWRRDRHCRDCWDKWTVQVLWSKWCLRTRNWTVFGRHLLTAFYAFSTYPTDLIRFHWHVFLDIISNRWYNLGTTVKQAAMVWVCVVKRRHDYGRAA